MHYLLMAICAFFVSLALTLAALRFFPRWGLLDRPHKYGLKRAPIPYFGGIAIVSAFMLSVLIFVPLDQRVILILGMGMLLAVVSFVDDRKGLSPYFRLAVQILAGVLLVFAGLSINSIASPFGGAPWDLLQWSSALGVTFDAFGVQIGLLSAVLTVCWVVFLMNALNWVDGISGLSSGVGVIASFVLFFLSIKSGFHSVDQTVMSSLALILGSVLFAFWFFDFYPPKILMGDTGSMFVGFMLATLAVLAGGKIVTVMLVLGFPIVDALWVILRRILAGKSPFKGDLLHLHHRLLGSGLSERQTLLLIYSASGLFGVLAIFLGTTQKLWALLALFLTVAVTGFLSSYFFIENKQK